MKEYQCRPKSAIRHRSRAERPESGISKCFSHIKYDHVGKYVNSAAKCKCYHIIWS